MSLDLRQFTDPDGPDTIARLMMVGPNIAGADGKIIAWRRADPDETANPTEITVLPGIIERLDANQPTEWHRLPESLPIVADDLQPCSACDGTGKTTATKPCPDCDGAGECFHCGHECPTCDGDGTIDNDDPREVGDPCPECGGSGKVIRDGEMTRWINVYGIAVSWVYVAMLVRIGAEVTPGELEKGRKCLRWRVGETQGFVMPMATDGNAKWSIP